MQGSKRTENRETGKDSNSMLAVACLLKLYEEQQGAGEVQKLLEQCPQLHSGRGTEESNKMIFMLWLLQDASQESNHIMQILMQAYQAYERGKSSSVQDDSALLQMKRYDIAWERYFKRVAEEAREVLTNEEKDRLHRQYLAFLNNLQQSLNFMLNNLRAMRSALDALIVAQTAAINVLRQDNIAGSIALFSNEQLNAVPEIAVIRENIRSAAEDLCAGRIETKGFLSQFNVAEERVRQHLQANNDPYLSTFSEGCRGRKEALQCEVDLVETREKAYQAVNKINTTIDMVEKIQRKISDAKSDTLHMTTNLQEIDLMQQDVRTGVQTIEHSTRELMQSHETYSARAVDVIKLNPANDNLINVVHLVEMSKESCASQLNNSTSQMKSGVVDREQAETVEVHAESVEARAEAHELSQEAHLDQLKSIGGAQFSFGDDDDIPHDPGPGQSGASLPTSDPDQPGASQPTSQAPHGYGLLFERGGNSVIQRGSQVPQANHNEAQSPTVKKTAEDPEQPGLTTLSMRY